MGTPAGCSAGRSAVRFANQLQAWIEVEDGRITGHGISGQGRLGSATVRLHSHGLTFAWVALPDLVRPPQVDRDRVVFTQTAGGHTGAPVPRPLPEGMLLSERPIAAGEVHLLLDGLLVIEIDRRPVVEVSPGAIFDPAMRTPYSKGHVTVRARTPSRLAVLRRAQLDDQALLRVATEQATRLNAHSTDLGVAARPS